MEELTPTRSSYQGHSNLMAALMVASNRSGGNWKSQRSSGGNIGNKANCQSCRTAGDNLKRSGKLFPMERQAAEDEDHIVTGIFLTSNVPSFVLFDSRTTHSFVFKSHA